MELKVLGSGSSGNCYILDGEKEALIIEAGIPFLEVKKALDFNVIKIAGVIVSHCHGDHSKYVKEYERAGIKVFTPYNDVALCEIAYRKFKIYSFPLIHDVPCFGFYIEHPEMGSLVYASDTEYIRWKFKDVNHILVEANYNDDLVTKGAVNKEHVLRGHMSLNTALKFISANDNPTLENVVLIHLSQSNGDPVEFLQKTKETIKYESNCYIAEKGLEVSLDLIPFM